MTQSSLSYSFLDIYTQYINLTIVFIIRLLVKAGELDYQEGVVVVKENIILFNPLLGKTPHPFGWRRPIKLKLFSRIIRPCIEYPKSVEDAEKGTQNT
jgi:hypothetical protein